MAKTLNLNVTDTGVEGVTTLALDKAIINYGEDFRVKSQDASSVILTNMTSPLDKPETYRVAVSPVKDIYKGSSIDPNLYSVSRKGVSILCGLQKVYTVTDSADTSYEKDLPASGHIVLKVPADAVFTADVVEDLVGRIVAGLYESGSITTERLTAIMRGSLIPKDL